MIPFTTLVALSSAALLTQEPVRMTLPPDWTRPHNFPLPVKRQSVGEMQSYRPLAVLEWIDAELRGENKSRENDALDEAHAERSCSMGVGCGTAGVCYAKAHGRPEECPNSPTTCTARQFSDQMVCAECNLSWDVNDSFPPDCLSCHPPTVSWLRWVCSMVARHAGGAA